MAKPQKIGNRNFKSKKDAIAHYRSILNSYDFGQSLNKVDFSDLLDLLNYNTRSDFEDDLTFVDRFNNGINPFELPSEFVVYVSDVKVSRVQFNTRCFEVFFDNDTSAYTSYIMLINDKIHSDDDLFYRACRSAVWDDIRTVKSNYFKGCKSLAACQETGIMSKWEELVVDHRQPNSFSAIVDRFKELYRIDTEMLEYATDKNNQKVFADTIMIDKFREYHREKANLRLVRWECNSSRSAFGRIKRTSKDLCVAKD